MKTFAKVLSALTIIVALAFVYILWGPGVQVSVHSITEQPASERQEVFESLVEGVKREDFGSNQFRRITSEDSGQYTFLTITLSVRNMNLLPAEWAQINLAPLSGDVVLIPGEPADVRPLASAKVTATLLVERTTENPTRTIWLEYYSMGKKQSASAVPDQ